MPDHDRPAGPLTPLVQGTGGVVAAVVFGAASALRRARVFHPDGLAFSATFVVPGGDHGSPLLDVPARHRAVVRLSRGVGLPEPLPDVLGLAVRIVDAHGPGRDQDLLLVTSGSAPGLRHALTPSRTYDHHRWSTLLPYRIRGLRTVFGARPLRTAGTGTERLDDLPAALASGRLRYAVEVATLTGPWREVGTLEVGEPLAPTEAADLGFDPARTGGGIRAAGVIQAVRVLAYRGSQAGRRLTATRGGWRREPAG